MSLVADASVVLAALASRDQTGGWAQALLFEERLFAPELVLIESTNAIRRLVQKKEIAPTEAKLAHVELMAMPFEIVEFSVLAERVWDLRDNFTAYDATYIALAEELDYPLATLDSALSSSSIPRCRFITP